MQPRLVSLLTNPDMLRVDQAYANAFAGGRLATEPPGREMWAKPLGNGSVAVVLFNRAGTVVGEVPDGAGPLPPHCHDPTSPLAPCTGCFVPYGRPDLSPCDDNATASSGAQRLTLRLDQLPPEWFGAAHMVNACAGLLDVFADAGARSAPLPPITAGTWSAVVPPHGVRFLVLSDCS